MSELLITARPCSQCLTTRNRIVSGARAAQIVKGCKSDGSHFICHKAEPGVVVHCRGVHDVIGGSRAHAFAMAMGPIREVEL